MADLSETFIKLLDEYIFSVSVNDWKSADYYWKAIELLQERRDGS